MSYTTSMEQIDTNTVADEIMNLADKGDSRLEESVRIRNNAAWGEY